MAAATPPRKIRRLSETVGSSISAQIESLSASGPLAEEAIARDLEDDELNATMSTGSDDSEDDDDDSTATLQQYSMINSYRRPSYVNAGGRSTVFSSSVPERKYLSRHEREAVRNEERSLLRDNKLIPPKHAQRRGSDGSGLTGLAKRASLSALRKVTSMPGDNQADLTSNAGVQPSECTSLIEDRSLPYGGISTPRVQKTWDEAVAAGKITTTWQRETKVLCKTSFPLILTFVLQYSLSVASVFTVGHIGKVELGAVSLGSMTATITGYAVYQGLATSLDTLCAQAYGSGRPHLVGLQFQRMLCFLMLITIPISLVWGFGTQILYHIVPEPEIAEYAGLYLKVMIAGAPGYAAFECGKRYVQAQGIFSANMYILLICAPLNAFLNWFLVWHVGLGFVGAPLAVVITETLLPILLLLYVVFIDGSRCWGGFDRRALQRWGPMVRLALPGLVMVLAEFLAFEILTLSASWLGSTALAAQSILVSASALTFQIPFPISIAASTRVANLIGATLSEPAKTSAKVATVMGAVVGVFNITLLSALKDVIPGLFTSEPDVQELVSNLLPLVAGFQLFDALAAIANGVLRGLGRQEVGGFVGLFAYYVVGLPISFGTGFGAGWGLWGLWSGPAIALGIVAAIEGVFIYNTSWEKAVEAAEHRNVQS